MATDIVNPALTCAAGRHTIAQSCTLRLSNCAHSRSKEHRPFHLSAEVDWLVSRWSWSCFRTAVLPARRPEIAQPQKTRSNTFKAALEPAGIPAPPPPPRMHGCRRQSPSQKESIQACLAGLTLVPKAG